MNLRFLLFVAKRYLFSAQKQHTINLITGVSMVGVALGTMALVIVLSVLNGFEKVVQDSFNNFDPELKITAVEGKSFFLTEELRERITRVSGVGILSEELSDMALMGYDQRQGPVVVKGVDAHFADITGIDTLIYVGAFTPDVSHSLHGVIGVGVAQKFNAGIDFSTPMSLYAPRREGKVNMVRPDRAFIQRPFFVSGIFAVQQPQYDENLVILPITLARELFSYPDSAVTALNLRTTPGVVIDEVKEQLSKELGSAFTVADRYEQQADFHRILQIEKWITFLILAFILLIATCNVIGSLSMLMIDKQHDTDVLRSLGATNRQLQYLFLIEGWLITIIGAFFGLIVGVGICLLQSHFGIIKMGTGFLVDAYPVVINPLDILLVFITVLGMGFLAAYYPAGLLKRRQTNNL